MPIHFDDQIAQPHTGLVGGPSLREAGDDELAADLRGVHAQPGPGRARGAAEARHVLEDRAQQVDRHEHVRIHRFSVDGFLHEQRADPHEAAVRADHRRAAPLRVGWRREDRLISTYSQYPANSRRAMTRAFSECDSPPCPMTTTPAPTIAPVAEPIGRAGTPSFANGSTSPKPVTWSYASG